MSQETETPPAAAELDETDLDLAVGGADPPSPDRHNQEQNRKA